MRVKSPESKAVHCCSHPLDLKMRNTKRKTPVMGVIDRPTNKEHAEDGAMANTDEAPAYHDIDRPHEAVAHSAGKYVRAMAHTNGLESHCALFLRDWTGCITKSAPSI